MYEVSGSTIIDMQRHRKERQEQNLLYEILLVSQDEPNEVWSDEFAIIAEREVYDAIMAEVLPMVANSGFRPH
ncbi:MAG: hypothetical protein ACI9PY_002671 [Ascidiaceihabitans sp.]|jgi:hypothetical protein